MKGRMWKWCEKRVFISFNRENRSFLFCGYISNFATVYHLILLVPPPAASGIESAQSWMIAASQDDVQVLGTPVQSLAECQSQEPWQTQGSHNCFWLLWPRAGCRYLSWVRIVRASWQKENRNCWNATVYICNAIILEQFHFLWTGLEVCFYLLLQWIIHSLWMRVIGAWLSQTGLLYPLSSNSFGMLQASVIFPAFVLSIHCSWC